MRDTEPNALAAQIEALRRLGPEGRMRLAAEMSEDLRRISIDGILRRNPELSPDEAKRELLRHLLRRPRAAEVARVSPRDE
ncbi:MAG: hypothetical protein IT384_22475 [Deltaproteobacteria bacterium]|nr:hypothetical protein [Deltaproteobacteria bacterium]